MPAHGRQDRPLEGSTIDNDADQLNTRGDQHQVPSASEPVSQQEEAGALRTVPAALLNTLSAGSAVGGVDFDDNAQVSGIVIGGNIVNQGEGHVNIYNMLVQVAELRPLPLGQKPPCPYPGLRSFLASDPYFFGREHEVQRAVRQLEDGHFLLVSGASSSGKSSLVHCGLLQELARSKPEGFWQMVVMFPSSRPVEELARQLGGDPFEPEATVSKLLALHGTAQRVLLVVDQFEALFTQAPQEEQKRFLELLIGLGGLDTWRTVLVMKAEFYHDLMSTDLWPVVSHQQLVIESLEDAELRRIIAEPAQSVGVEIEEALVERLVDDAAAEPGCLPLLQVTLVSLWQSLHDWKLTLDAYEQLGGGRYGGLAVALVDQADATLRNLTPDQQQLAVRIFLRLIQFGEGRPDTRRRQPLSALQAGLENNSLFKGTINQLRDNYLLALGTQGSDAGTTVDLGHEALITVWPRLQGWIKEYREAEQTRRNLDGMARYWAEHGFSLDGLLSRPELQDAETWLSSEAAKVLGYSPELARLVDASRKAFEAEEQERENKRLADEKRLRADKEKAETIARQAQALASARAKGLALLGTALVVVLCLAGLAWWQWSVAEEARINVEQLRAEELARQRVDRAISLALQSREQSAIDPQLSLLLAIEAVAATEGNSQTVRPEAVTALHDALILPGAGPVLSGHSGGVTSAAYSPDGLHIVTVSSDGYAIKWNANNGSLQGQTKVSDRFIHSVAWSRDGRSIALGGKDGQIRVLNPDNMSLRALPLLTSGQTEEIYSVAFSSDSTQLLAGGSDGTAKVWDIASGSLVRTLPEEAAQSPSDGNRVGIMSVAWSADGHWIATGRNDGSIALWNGSTMENEWLGHNGRVLALAFSPDGKGLVSAGDTTARLWEIESWSLVRTLSGHTQEVRSVAYSPDSHSILTAGWDGTARVWDVTTGEMARIIRGHSRELWVAIWSPDGRYITTTSHDRTARIWDAIGRGERPTLDQGGPDALRNGPLSDAAYSPDGKWVAAAVDGKVNIWDAESGIFQRSLASQSAQLISLAWDPKSSLLATGGSNGMIMLWQASTGTLQSTFAETHASGSPIVSLDFSPDGRFIIAAGGSRVASIWQASTGKPVRDLSSERDGHIGNLWRAVWSHGGDFVATASDDGRVKVWDANAAVDSPPLHTYPPDGANQAEALFDVAWSQDDTHIVTADWEGTATIWDVGGATRVRTLLGHRDVVFSAAYSPGPQGDLIVTASADGTAQLWDATSGTALATLHGHVGKVRRAKFSPDGKRVLTAGEDGTARQYLASVEDALDEAVRRTTRALTSEERVRFLIDPEPEDAPPKR